MCKYATKNDISLANLAKQTQAIHAWDMAVVQSHCHVKTICPL